jgi:hypothetical protein
LEQRGERGIRGWTKIHLWDLIAATATVVEISSYVRSCLKTRPAWRVDAPQKSHADLPLRKPTSSNFQVNLSPLHMHG